MSDRFRLFLTIDEPHISFRVATPDDVPFLLELRRQTMVPHQLASGMTPSEEELVSRVLAGFEFARIVLVASQPVGLLKVRRDGLQWEVMQIQLAPSWQYNAAHRLRHYRADDYRLTGGATAIQRASR